MSPRFTESRAARLKMAVNPTLACSLTMRAIMIGPPTLSIGTTRDGFIANCRPLPTDEPNLKQLEVQSHRGTACGTDELVAALVKAARDVARLAPGVPMTVGNIGRVGGGDLSWSVSHNSGRDADLGFFLLGPDGKPFVARDLVRLDGGLRGFADGTPVRLDLRRTWLLVRSLLTNPDVEIQWLFVSSPIRVQFSIEIRQAQEQDQRTTLPWPAFGAVLKVTSFPLTV